VFPTEAVDKVKRVFQEFDTDGNGTMSRVELGFLLTRLGNFSKEEIDKIMNEVDKDESGEIEYDEFLSWIATPGAKLDVVDGEAVRFDLDTALQPLFRIFDRSGNGIITRTEFHDCYNILAGALKALPAQEGAVPIAALAMSEEERIFAIADRDSDDVISFAEFVSWQREAIQHSGISRTHLVEVVQQLASLLEGILMLSRPAKLSDGETFTQDPVLKQIIPKVANCSRELWRRNKGRPSHTSQDDNLSLVVWPELPVGIDTTKLVRRHLQEPVPTVGVTRVDVRIHSCVPDLAATADGAPGPPRWLAKVLRSVKDTRGKTVATQYYYTYQEDKWDALAEQEEFNRACAALPVEFRLYALLLSEANFGDALIWSKIQLVMQDAVKMGLLTAEEHLEFNLNIEKSMIRELEKAMTDPTACADYEKRKELLVDMLPKAEFSPSEVMRALTAYGIIRGHSFWMQPGSG